jgi:hypothetical protein
LSATTVQLLQAAAEIVGGDRALARELGISEALLGRFMNDSRELPDMLLLRAVDIILADRQAHLPVPLSMGAAGLSSGDEILQNSRRGNGAATPEGGGG